MVRQGRDVGFLTSVEAEGSPYESRTGAVPPAHLTSDGKAFLADLPAADFDRRYSRQGFRNSDLVPNKLGLLRRDLNTTSRPQVSAKPRWERTTILAIGMPLHSGGRPAAAISVAVQSVRFSSARVREMLPAVRCCGCYLCRTWQRVAPVAAVGELALGLLPERGAAHHLGELLCEVCLRLQHRGEPVHLTHLRR